LFCFAFHSSSFTSSYMDLTLIRSIFSSSLPISPSSSLLISPAFYPFQPSFNLFWYVQAQHFDQFLPFFNYLFLITFLLFLPALAIRFFHIPSFLFFCYTFLGIFLFPHDSVSDTPYHCILFTLFLHLFPQFSSFVRIKLLVFLLFLFIFHYTFFIVFSSLWLKFGSGNANFLFFQALFGHFALFFGFVEIIAAVRIASKQKPEGKISSENKIQ
jgi:hypothetical protein